MVDHVSVCSVRAHSKWSVELGHCSSLLLKFTPPFETVIDGRSSIYVFSESPFKTVGRIRPLLEFTAQVYCSHLLLKLPASPAGLLPESPSSLVPIKYTTSVTFKFTARVTFKFTPHLKLSLMTDQVLADICLQWEPMQNCSSLLLRFTCKFNPLPIEHGSMAYHYTEEVSHIAECMYTLGSCTPLNIDVLHTITPSKFHISKHAHIPMADGPPAINHTSMLHHYTQEVSHIEECKYTHGRWTPSNWQ